MTRPAVDQLLYLLDEAFTGQEWHALLPNLRTVTPDAWNWLPPGGHRSIRAIVQHVGAGASSCTRTMPSATPR